MNSDTYIFNSDSLQVHVNCVKDLIAEELLKSKFITKEQSTFLIEKTAIVIVKPNIFTYLKDKLFSGSNKEGMTKYVFVQGFSDTIPNKLTLDKTELV